MPRPPGWARCSESWPRSAIGVGIYRGGVRLNLSRFFRVTAAVLVLVAAGLVASAIHTAHEAAGSTPARPRPSTSSWLVRPGTDPSSLATGVLGIQPQPDGRRGDGWLLYAIPMLIYVLWPHGARRRSACPRTQPARAGREKETMIAVPRRSPASPGLLALRRPHAARAPARTAASSGASGAHEAVAVTLSDAGCAPANASVPAGPITFEVTNAGTAKVTELELLDEQGMISASARTWSRASRLILAQPAARHLQAQLPQRRHHAEGHPEGHRRRVRVRGRPARRPPSDAGHRRLQDLRRQPDRQAAGRHRRRSSAALKAGDLAEGQGSCSARRACDYETIEPVAESFGDLDPEIDARINDVASASEWTGFHRIEKILWAGTPPTGTAPYATKLLAGRGHARAEGADAHLPAGRSSPTARSSC